VSGASGVRARTTGAPDNRARKAPRRRRWIVLLMGAVTVVVLALYNTPLLGVRSMQVIGNTTLTTQNVLAAADVHVGEPMLQVDTGQIEARLRALPQVASAQVSLAWPSAVRLAVVERVPMAFVTTPNGIQLVDSEGVPFAGAAQPPPGFPELRVRSAAANDPATRAAVLVLASLPAALRGSVTAVVPQTPNDVRMSLRDGREVRWGDASDSAWKAAVLPPLLTRPGKVYDVSSPALPTIANG
jgi:cell division protein FtsQ